MSVIEMDAARFIVNLSTLLIISLFFHKANINYQTTTVANVANFLSRTCCLLLAIGRMPLIFPTNESNCMQMIHERNREARLCCQNSKCTL